LEFFKNKGEKAKTEKSLVREGGGHQGRRLGHQIEMEQMGKNEKRHTDGQVMKEVIRKRWSEKPPA